MIRNIFLVFLGASMITGMSCGKDKVVKKEKDQPERPAPPGEEKVYTARFGKIWDLAPHSAFTDLVRFNNAFYCVFRESASHTSHDGRIRILRSVDGNTWTSVRWFQKAPEGPYSIDLRDPKISVTPDNRLMVLVDVEYWLNNNGTYTRQNFRPCVSYSDAQGTVFDDLQSCSVYNPGLSTASYWIWRVSWNRNGEGYGFDYINSPLTLLRTADGKAYHAVTKLSLPNSPNEATVRFDKQDNMYVLVRCESGGRNGILMVAPPPYYLFTQYPLKMRLGGPDFEFLSDTTLCMGTRFYTSGKPDSTAIYITDLKGNVKKRFPLPSGGDCSYPGMVLYNDTLWTSYYSSHTGKASIHFTKIPVVLLEK
ncbi:hypothetical protein [Niabella aurantiaca]|uniref:hypothetical protein n=1 Tax=Niabella aurantiaca TaxID=379900 RepID=UPI00037E7538|nr:hypothetical protein [Niabella aurantiaca]